MLQFDILRWAIKFNASAYRGWMGCRLSLGLGIETISATAGLISVRLSTFTICSKIGPVHFKMDFSQTTNYSNIYKDLAYTEFETHIHCLIFKKPDKYFYVKE